MTRSEAPALGLDFVLPPEFEASEPPEARGLSRDGVRLMVSSVREDRILHTQFKEIGSVLRPGDLLVINSSATLNAALPAWRADGLQLELHLSTQLNDDIWVIELRLPTPKGNLPFRSGLPGEFLQIPDDVSVGLLEPLDDGKRLWKAQLHLPEGYLDKHGFPIRYGYVPRSWPLPLYQTAFAVEVGSAEMPSAARGFTPELVTSLISSGIQFAPIVLHTGVSSLEAHEPPYAERYRVPEVTARAVNSARGAGCRVIAVGTTVVRALETAVDPNGHVQESEGWTDLVVTRERGLRTVDGLLTGFHEPKATHLAMLEAIAERAHLERVYREALRQRYLWHEFGDLHLLLP